MDAPKRKVCSDKGNLHPHLCVCHVGLQKESELIVPFRLCPLRLCHPACVVCGSRTASWVFALGCPGGKVVNSCLPGVYIRPLEEN